MRRRRPTPATRRGRLPPRHRRLLAAALAGVCAGGTAFLALERPAGDAVPALVAVRELPAGHLLSAGDVQVRAVPTAAVPAGALTGTVAALDRTLVSPLARGEVLTALDLRTSALLRGSVAGTVAVFLPLSEPAVAASVEAADRVDVHSPVDGSVVVSRALVLRAVGDERPGLWLAVDATGARALAAARGADPVGASLQVALHPQP